MEEKEMTLKVIDISSYQSAAAVNTPGTDAVIVKVSQGTGYINPNCDSQYQEAKRQGKLLGLYHYLNGVGAKAEAKFFVDNSTGYWKNDPVTLWADWEGGDNGAWGNGAYVAEFIAEVNRLVGVACCGIYTGVDGISQSGSYLAATTPLWFAGYPDLRDSWDAPDFMYSIKPWETLTMWQFTDSQGKLDRSIFYGDANTWNKLSVKPNGGSKPAPAPKPQPAPSTASYSTSGKNLETMAGDVQSGKVGDGPTREKVLGGYYTGVQAIINERAKVIDGNTSHSILADETKKGRYGDGDTRKHMLGTYYQAVQDIINGGSQPVSNPEYVTVEAGDSVSSIAQQFGVSVDNIIRLNSLENPDLIYVGQRLRIK